MNGRVRDRFAAALLGCAIGDALGAPFEGVRARRMREVPDLLGGFRPHRGLPPGQYTDDTQLTLATAESLAACRGVNGRDMAERMSRFWRERTIVGGGASCRDAMRSYLRGTPWEECGTEEGRAGNGTAMRASPLGLWFWDEPEEIPEAARVNALITHRDPRCAAGSAAVARVVAHAVERGARAEGSRALRSGFLAVDRSETVELAAGAAEVHDPEFAGYIRELPRWLTLPEEEALGEIAAAGWEPGSKGLDFITGFVVPTVLAALFFFLWKPGDFKGAVEGALRAGGDVDTVASIVGALTGALGGMACLPPPLAEGVKDASAIRVLGERLFEAKGGGR
ncbi:MAG: ADP-ribosylglycohydrolase family protein [Nitrospinota bacterium]